MTRPGTSQWKRLFVIACELIEQVNQEQVLIDCWTFGGGTALMLQIGHRDSYDVDIFLHDPQLLGFLDPAKNDFEFTLMPSSYSGDGSRHIKLSFEGMGDIDYIVAGFQSDPGYKVRPILDREVKVETPGEIIAKKIVYRGASIRPRDVFDIAATITAIGERDLAKTLEPYPDAIRATQTAMRNFNPDFITRSINELSIRSDFVGLADSSYETARNFLEGLL